MKNFLHKKVVTNYTSKWLIFCIDLYIISNTFLLAYLVRFNFSLDFNVSDLIIQIPLVLVAGILSFLMIGSYKNIIRHSGYRDAVNVLVASFVVFALLVFIVVINRQFQFYKEFTIPISILTIHFLLNGFALISSRYLVKEFYYLLTSENKFNKKVLIYGAGEAGLLTFDVLNNDPISKSKVKGFIDDNSSKIGKKLRGIDVYAPSIIDSQFIEKKNIKEIIIAIQNLKPSRLRGIVDSLASLPVQVKIVPPAANWVHGDFKSHEIKQVLIEDLLGRTPIELDNPVLKKELNNKVILVTGAAGSIGSEIARQITYFSYKHVVLIDQAESELYNLQQYFYNNNINNVTSIVGDVRDKKRMNVILKQYKPEIVFHAAAYKHVPFMEDNPYEAVRVNIAGTRIMADLAIQHKVEKFVMISTDKAVNPTNVMGATKRIAELYINCLAQNGTTKFITTRFGNVLGSNGSVIPLFKNQIELGGPLTVTHKDITRYFMTIPEACQLVLEAGGMGNGGEIFVFDMGESIKIYDLALKMIHLSGLKYPEDITIKITGLRPGEKIYEELLANGENTTNTHHEKIMIANVKPIDIEVVKKNIEELCNSNHHINFNETVLKMKAIVPEFKSNNSTFEELDKSKNDKDEN